MTDYTDLIEKLRGYTGPWLVPAKAADALAALVKDIDVCIRSWEYAEVQWDEERDTLQARVKRLEAVLRSIAANTCCDPCQEARRVAQAALEEGDKP